jgi:DNA-directed RNA polymerase I subunit RPA1
MSGDRFELPTRRLKGVHFSSFSTAETKQLSVKELTNPVSFDSLQHPTIGGLYDPAMGPVELQDFCTTCHQKAMHCPGHMAHISLPLPVFNPLYFPLACQLLKVTCLCCDHLLLTKPRIHLIKCQLRLLFKGLLVEALELEDIFYRGITNGNEDSSNTVESLGDVSLLDEFVDAAMGDSDAQSSAGRAQSKNLNEARRAIVDQFFKSFNQFKECGNCSAPARKLKKEGMKKVLLKPLSAREAKQWALAKQQHWSKQPTDIKEGKEAPSYDNELKVSQEIQYLSPLDIRSHLMQLFQLEGQLLSMLISLSKGAVGADMFFLEVIPVPPPKFRPSNFASGLRYDNPQTTNLNLVLKSSQELHQLLKEESQEKEEPVDRKTHIQQVHSAWQTLQFSVSSFIDSDIFKFSTNRPSGVRQILEKKDGLFRKHLMGKRVNYAARSVISPDPYINVDEVGIPMVFAQKLTFPQPVTSLNVQEMREAVTNGPLGYPGATKVEHEDGTITRLNPENLSQRKSLAKQLLTPPVRWNPLNTCKKVHRYLKDGDMLLLNRQPTLHRPSIMGHKARVLKGQKTLRLHYSNCKSYNADFDGDEMNVHFPQNELGRAEVLTVASANFQYLVPKDGKPLGGLIQDHLVSAVLMTARGCLFNRQDYMQLVFCALPECESRIAFLPPCICKPSHLWSGKQIISTILLTLIPSTSEKLNMTGQSKVPHKEWKNTNSRALFSQLRDEEMSESEIVVRGGELLCGVLDKSQIGPSQFGLAHCCYELYGGEMVGKLLSALAKLLTSYLQYHGFTLGVEDILVKPKGDHKRTKLLKKAGECGPFAAAKAFELADHSDTGQGITTD